MRWSLPFTFALLPFLGHAQWTYSGDTTPTWEQVIARYQELDARHGGAKLLTIGADDGGQPIHLFVVSDGSGFTPDSIRAAGKNILWITNGIHPGEPDGVDASLLLAQALLESDQLMGLAVHNAICIVPMYNVSGAVERGSHSRANQLGPMEYGFRANALNLDLNRDFIKMDAQNTWTLVRALTAWDPDVYFETHVSNGADHRYVMELLTTQDDKLGPAMGRFMRDQLVPDLYAWMDRKGFAMCPYFETVADVPDSGLVGFYDSPRYSTGYNALFDRIGVLSETHMLKTYADRVNATFHLMLATLATMNEHPQELRAARKQAKAYTASMEELGLNWELDTTVVEDLPWKGYAASMEPSKVSGLLRLRYDHARPVDTMVPWMDTYRPSLVKQKPAAYLVPRQWSAVIERLEASGVKLEPLVTEFKLVVEQDSIGAFTTVQQPYEGHYLHRRVQGSTVSAEVIAHAGDVLVRMGQPTDRYVMETLELTAEDGFFAWNFFDSRLQQKEWFSDYVFEDIAADLLEQDPALKAALETRRTADPSFAADAWAQLLFIYQRSPYFEKSYRQYPVLRVVTLPAELRGR
ncbi:MAG: hypothetical protein IPN85_05185 [Flavobacteriales bacterium]|nr:hypothetical protein [Flavobacteriales bacterium]